MKFDPTSPEYASVEALAEFLMDDERTSFFPGEAQAVAIAARSDVKTVTEELRSYGFKVVTAEIQRTIRGFNSNPNGTHPFQANPTFTTSGSSNILGFAGTEGY
jgi:hypothetical protein